MITIIKKGTPKEEIRKTISQVLANISKRDISKYAGKLRMEVDPLQYQQKMRDEWK